MLVQLTRFPNPLSSPGILLVDGLPFLMTLELPWKDNKQSISCIPEGEYRVESHYSHRFKNVFKVFDVPGRFDILFHAGNSVKDTHGCILVGNSFTLNKEGEVRIINSRIALNEMRSRLGKIATFTLVIKNA